MTPKVSVVVPIYNCEKYLGACLESLSKQTLKEIQVILVDDGSMDSSAEICKQYVDNYPFFEYYHKENGGSASARNIGIENAKGEYLGFVDSDDWVESDMYERMYDCAKSNNNADIVFCRVFEDETPGSKEYIFPRGGYYNRDDMKKELFPYLLPCVNEMGTFRNIRWSNCIRLFKRNLIKENGIRYFERSRRCEDLAFSLECAITAKDYYYLEKSLYHNVPNSGSKSRNYTQYMWNSIKNLIMYINEVCLDVSDYDFEEKIKVNAFYFCVMVIKNEMNCNNKKEAISNIKAVIEDDICKSSLCFEGIYRLNKELCGLRKKIITGDPYKVYSYLKFLALKKNRIMPIVSLLLSSPAIKKVYLRFRG